MNKRGRIEFFYIICWCSLYYFNKLCRDMGSVAGIGPLLLGWAQPSGNIIET